MFCLLLCLQEQPTPGGTLALQFDIEFEKVNITTDGKVSNFKMKVCYTPAGELA